MPQIQVLPVAAIAQIGGIFALLVLVHFVADWVFQSHAEAMAKPKDHWVRARHCFIYTVICLGAITLTTWPSFEAVAWMAGILFFSHFFEDTYLPVFVWAKLIRKPPEMFPPAKRVIDLKKTGAEATEIVPSPPPRMKEFVEFASSPLGKILLIAIDQIVHLVFLLPVAAMIVLPESTTRIGILGATFTALLMNITLIGSNWVKQR